MSKAQPPAPPDPPTGMSMNRAKLIWRVILISNFALGAYLFSRPKKKDETDIHTRKGHRLQKEKTVVEVPEPEPPAATDAMTTSMDLLFDYDALYFPVSIPEEVRPPITDEQQREVFQWILEEKRKLNPKNSAEKKQIDKDKAILKQFIRADNIPKI